MTDKAMSRTTHVVRRGATYYFRLRVPADLVDHYGKQEITFSLKTKDQAEAKLKSHTEALRHLAEFEGIRKGLTACLTEFMSPEEIQNVAQGLAHDLLDEDQTKRTFGQNTEDYRIGIEAIEENARPILAGDWKYNDGDCRRWMTKAVLNHLDGIGLKVLPQSDLEQQLIYACAEALVGAVDVIKERNNGKLVAMPDRPVAASMRAPVGSSHGKAVTLSSVIEEYAQEQERAGNWQGKTGPENRAIYRLLIEITGNPLVSELGYAPMRTFKETLLRLPANINRDPRYRGKTIPDILVMPDVEPMSITTVNKYLTRASSLLKWSQQHGYVDRNYAEGLSITQRGRKASDERGMFEESHVEAIFKTIAEGRVTSSGKTSSFHYWAPLLGYLTGARINEIASLRLSDFQEKDGIPFIAITQQNDGDKATKTQAGLRDIPLHPELIRLGLLRQVKALREKGVDRLFPELKLTKNGYGSKVTSWFSGHTSKADSFLWRQASVRDDGLSFHSFRHTMATLLERNGIDKVMTKRILGHSLSDDVTYGRYSKGAEVAQIRAAIVAAIPIAPLQALQEFELWVRHPSAPKEKHTDTYTR